MLLSLNCGLCHRMEIIKILIRKIEDYFILFVEKNTINYLFFQYIYWFKKKIISWYVACYVFNYNNLITNFCHHYEYEL